MFSFRSAFPEGLIALDIGGLINEALDLLKTRLPTIDCLDKADFSKEVALSTRLPWDGEVRLRPCPRVLGFQLWICILLTLPLTIKTPSIAKAANTSLTTHVWVGQMTFVFSLQYHPQG